MQSFFGQCIKHIFLEEYIISGHFYSVGFNWRISVNITLVLNVSQLHLAMIPT